MSGLPAGASSWRSFGPGGLGGSASVQSLPWSIWVWVVSVAVLPVAAGCDASQCGWPPMCFSSSGSMCFSSSGSSVPCHVTRLFTMYCECMCVSACVGVCTAGSVCVLALARFSVFRLCAAPRWVWGEAVGMCFGCGLSALVWGCLRPGRVGGVGVAAHFVRAFCFLGGRG